MASRQEKLDYKKEGLKSSNRSFGALASFPFIMESIFLTARGDYIRGPILAVAAGAMIEGITFAATKININLNK